MSRRNQLNRPIVRTILPTSIRQQHAVIADTPVPVMGFEHRRHKGLTEDDRHDWSRMEFKAQQGFECHCAAMRELAAAEKAARQRRKSRVDIVQDMAGKLSNVWNERKSLELRDRRGRRRAHHARSANGRR